MTNPVDYANIVDKSTDGENAATLINDTKRAVNEIISVDLEALGTSASRDVGTSAGDVMEVGSFGLGATNQTELSVDANTMLTGGSFSLLSSSANIPIVSSGELNVGVINSSRTIHTFSTPDGRVWKRARNNSWSDWEEVWTTNNLTKGTSAGDVMEVGAFGLGDKPINKYPAGINVDDSTLIGGRYQFYADNNFTGTLPAGITVSMGYILTVVRSHNTAFLADLSVLQRLRTFRYKINREWTRSYDLDDATWSNWEEVLTSSNIGTNAGDVMEVGAFGLGGVPANVIDANDAIINGWYGGGGANGLNYFTEISGAYGTLFVETRQSNQIVQTNTISNRSGKRYSSDTGATWTDWEEVFTTANLQTQTPLGLNVARLMINRSGVTLSDGQVVTGSAIRIPFVDSSGVVQSGSAPSGSWELIHGQSVSNMNGGVFVRVV
jgi:hypothetical protein